MGTPQGWRLLGALSRGRSPLKTLLPPEHKEAPQRPQDHCQRQLPSLRCSHNARKQVLYPTLRATDADLRTCQTPCASGCCHAREDKAGGICWLRGPSRKMYRLFSALESTRRWITRTLRKLKWRRRFGRELPLGGCGFGDGQYVTPSLP